MNRKNLIPLAERTPEERLEICRKGAEASNRVQAEKKTMRQAFEVLMELSTKKGKPISLAEVESLKDIEGKPLTVRDAVVVGMAIKASKGDTKAAEFIRDTMGEKPSDKIEVSGLEEEKSKLDEILNQRKKRDDK